MADNGEDRLTAATTITAGGKKVEKITFKNIYTPKPDDSKRDVTLVVEKTVESTGDVQWEDLSGFEFILYDKEANTKRSATTKSDGKAYFEFTAPADQPVDPDKPIDPDQPDKPDSSKTGDNEYYLHRLLNGRWNVGGTIFQDYRCPADYTAWHTIIYGHHMKNGTMFGSLQNYKEQSYYDENPAVYLLTQEKDFKVELIAGFLSDADGEVYTLPNTQQERDELVAYCLAQSDFQSQTQVQSEDRLLTLSTCSDDYNNARYVLVGVLRELTRETE